MHASHPSCRVVSFLITLRHNIYILRTKASRKMYTEKGFKCLPLKLFLISAFFLSPASPLKIGETCSGQDACDSGLICGTCAKNGRNRSRCALTKPTIPTTKVKGLPFNKYSWLTTHNSFARRQPTSGAGSILLTHINQEDTIPEQLNNGVRGLMLDTYDFNDDVWLCHSFQGACLNVTSFEPAMKALQDIKVFLDQNPTEIVTIFIEDYVKTPNALSRVLEGAGLREYMFPLSELPKNGEDWPMVDDMVRKNHRLIVFNSDRSKESSEKIAYAWNYVVENQYGNEGMKPNTCEKRSESNNMDDHSRSLVLMNYFPTNPDESQVCSDNSVDLVNMTQTCFKASGNRCPNFIAVDFYKRSDGGGASAAVNMANGNMTCGCDSIDFCREGAKFGVCDVPVLPPSPAAQPPPSPSPVAAESLMEASAASSPMSMLPHCCWLVMTLLSMFHFF